MPSVSLDTTVGLHRTAAAKSRDADLGLKIQRPGVGTHDVRGQECVRTALWSYVFATPGLGREQDSYSSPTSDVKSRFYHDILIGGPDHAKSV